MADQSSIVAEALGRREFNVRDRDGKQHIIPSMTFGDARDLEKAIGCALSDAGKVLSEFDGQIKILWVVVRREGLTRQQIRDSRATGKWALSEEDVADMFDLSQAMEVFAAVTQALKQGGYEAVPTIAGAPA